MYPIMSGQGPAPPESLPNGEEDEQFGLAYLYLRQKACAFHEWKGDRFRAKKLRGICGCIGLSRSSKISES